LAKITYFDQSHFRQIMNFIFCSTRRLFQNRLWAREICWLIYQTLNFQACKFFGKAVICFQKLNVWWKIAFLAKSNFY